MTSPKSKSATDFTEDKKSVDDSSAIVIETTIIDVPKPSTSGITLFNIILLY